MKKIFAGFLSCLVLAMAIPAEAAASNIPPYEPPIEAHVTVKWGNVHGTPQYTNRVSFDGELSVSDGRVELTRKLKFETHDDEKDAITRKSNPVRWKSWIFNHWDGIKAVIKADPRETVTVETDAGTVSVPYATLLTAPRATKLNLGDGREIVINVTKVVTDPFYLYTIWGGPINTVAEERAVQTEMADFADRLQKVVTTDEFKAVLDSRPDIASIRKDFSGALAFENGASGKLVETILFEPGHGDKITQRDENYVEWDSYIYNHFDGLFLKAQLDQSYPVDDTVAIKFGEIGWSKEFSLAGLYVYGVHTEKVEVDGQAYLVGMVAVKKPFCDRPALHTANPSICDPDPVPVPTPVPLPQPIPAPKPLPVEPVVIKPVDEALTVKKVDFTSLR